MSKSQTDNPVLIVVIVALFGGLLGMLIGAWVADFNFYNPFSPAMMVVAIFATGGVLVGLAFGTLLALTPRRDARR